MMALPRADATTRECFVHWLKHFSAFVREVDYDGARPLFHKEILAFGTHRDVIASLDQWVTGQWDNVWPKTSDFRFDIEGTEILISADASMACVIAPWTSTGYYVDGSTFERPGRATLVFHRRSDDLAEPDTGFADWLCTHSHMSLNRGVPDASHADRPVKTGA